jgi:thiol:disulfide interchange protein DsbC
MKVDIDEAKKFIVKEIGQEVEAVEVDTELLGVPLITLYTSDDIFYYSQDMSILISGHFYDRENNYASLTEASLGQKRFIKAKSLFSSAISYKTANAIKDVYVFTDVDCGYCVKLHKAKQTYLQAGINVHYLPFPLSDEDSLSYAKNRQIWCEQNKLAAFDLAIAKKLQIQPDCAVSFEKMISIAYELGVNATPTFFSTDGQLYEGIYTPEELMGLLPNSAK